VASAKAGDGCGLVLELIRCLDTHVGWAGDEIVRLSSR